MDDETGDTENIWDDFRSLQTKFDEVAAVHQETIKLGNECSKIFKFIKGTIMLKLV